MSTCPVTSSHGHRISGDRGGIDGVWHIVRFNWPRYAVAVPAIGLATALILVTSLPAAIAWGLGICIAPAAWWCVASLVVSHYVYDRSPLYRWHWLSQVLDRSPQRWINVHCGFDESTEALRRHFPHTRGGVLDLYDPALMTEPSIHRARRSVRGEDTTPGGGDAALDTLPEAAFDAAFLILAAHEIRAPSKRRRLFDRLYRSVRPGGRLIVVEHLRDAANFLAFGPGCIHFLPRHEWLRVARQSGFHVSFEKSVTPFVRCFVLSRPRTFTSRRHEHGHDRESSACPVISRGPVAVGRGVPEPGTGLADGMGA